MPFLIIFTLIFNISIACDEVEKILSGLAPDLQLQALDLITDLQQIQLVRDHLVGRKALSFAGSSRLNEGDSIDYTIFHELATLAANEGFAILTGGGPGLMDAANRAAFEVGVPSIGMDVQSAWEPHNPQYMDLVVFFKTLRSRRHALTTMSSAVVIGPGGLGSLDEVVSVVSEIYSGTITQRPIILYGRDFWNPLQNFIVEQMVSKGVAKSEHTRYFQIVDSPQEFLSLIRSL